MITIWDKIFEDLWLTLDRSSMQLAAALLSSKEDLQYWWYIGWNGKSPGRICQRRNYLSDPTGLVLKGQGGWDSLRQSLNLKIRRSDSRKSVELFNKSYENWKNRNISVE